MREDIVAIVCPDIHGRDFWKKAAEDYDGTVPFIFLGDYLDPYNDENITPEDAQNNFKEIWEFKEKWGDNVVLLLGNHDLSYYDKQFKTCRYCYGLADWYKDLLHRNIEKFKIAYSLENEGKTFLFSHAGINPNWFLNNFFDEKYDAKYVNSLFVTDPQSFDQYTYYRGGYRLAGSPVWCDIREFLNLKVDFNENIKQVVGHTQLAVDKLDAFNVTCIDSRQTFVITKNNEIEKY